MLIYIVRHGETDWNKEHKVQGAVDIPLNEYGIHLAEETADGLKNIRFDAAYSSPLSRAKKTAEVILKGRNIKIKEDKRIQEICFGGYEGMCIGGEQMDPKSGEFNKFFVDTENYVPIDGGETVPQLMKRTGEFLRELCENKELSQKNVLVTTHGAAMTALLNNIKKNFDVATFWENGVPANCAVTMVDVKEGNPEIIKENVIYYKEQVRTWKVEK